MDSWQSLVNGASAITIAGYLAAVVWQGGVIPGGTDGKTPNNNVTALIDGLIKDYQFLEFLIGAALLNLIVQIPGLHDVATVLILAAMLAVLLRFFENTGNLGALTDFANGKAGLFDTITKLFTGG